VKRARVRDTRPERKTSTAISDDTEVGRIDGGRWILTETRTGRV